MAYNRGGYDYHSTLGYLAPVFDYILAKASLKLPFCCPPISCECVCD